MSAIKFLALICGAAVLLAPVTAQSEESGLTVPVTDEAAPDSIRDAFRLHLGTFVAPSASFDENDVTLVRPHLRLIARAPIGARLTTEVSAGFSAGHYDVDGDEAFFPDCVTCTFPDEFYVVSLGLRLGILLNTSRHLFRPGERWGLLLGGLGRARWEPGAFDDSFTGQGFVGIGYELPARLRLALGARVANSIEDGDVSVDPAGQLRWEINEKLRLRTRNIGLELEWRPADTMELFLSGFRQSEHFRLDSREGAPEDLSIRDRQILVGAGIEWKRWRHVRFVTEAGAIVDRNISVSSMDDGRLDSVSGDPSPYFELSIELRP